MDAETIFAKDPTTLRTIVITILFPKSPQAVIKITYIAFLHNKLSLKILTLPVNI